MAETIVPAFWPSLAEAVMADAPYVDDGPGLSLFADRAALRSAVQTLWREGYALDDVSVLDVAEGFLAVWHFAAWGRPGSRPAPVVLRVLAPHADPWIDSIADIYQGAEWHEREAMEMYGLTFRGNPNPIPLLLPPDMAEKPLAKAEGERAPLTKALPFCRAAGAAPVETPAGEDAKPARPAKAGRVKPAASQTPEEPSA